jgi:hypothetical protein
MRRFPKHAIGFALLLATASLVPAFASAQPSSSGTVPYAACTKTVTTAESDLAHQKYIAGKQDYDEGNYDSAIRRFRDAYSLDCTKHELLIIISAAYERKGDKKEALNALETYVARAPTAPDVGTYQAKIDNLKKQIATAPPPPASTTPPSGTSTPPSGEVQEHTVYPWLVTGAGVAALGVGIVLVATAPDLPPKCDEETSTCESLGKDATGKEVERPDEFVKRQQRAGTAVDQPKWGTVVIVGGAVLIVGGLVWHFLEPTGSKEAWQKKLHPSFGPNYGGLSFDGTF